MKYIEKDDKHIIKLEKGDKVIETLLIHIKDTDIGFGQIEMFGAVENVELGYMFAPGKYNWKSYTDGGYELLSAKGSISWDNNEPQIHMHAAISDSKFNVIGGHVKEMVIHGVGEVFITILSYEKVTKVLDEKSGLRLWDI